MSSSSKAGKDFSQLKGAAIILLKVWIAVLSEDRDIWVRMVPHCHSKLGDVSLQMFTDQLRFKLYKMGVNRYVSYLYFIFQSAPLSPICSYLMVSSSKLFSMLCSTQKYTVQHTVTADR